MNTKTELGSKLRFVAATACEPQLAAFLATALRANAGLENAEMNALRGYDGGL